MNSSQGLPSPTQSRRYYLSNQSIFDRFTSFRIQTEPDKRTVMFSTQKTSAFGDPRTHSPENHMTATAEKFLTENTLNFETLRKEFIGNPKLPGLADLINMKNK
jgi:hypothetical protein